MNLKATREAYGEALVNLGSINSNVVAVDADLSCSTMSILFRNNFPDRFFNFGVAEQNMIGTASGLALSGKIVFASSFAIFASGRAWEQIRNTVASCNLNVKIVGSHGGISVGEDGSSHQSIEDIALMRAIPNMTVIIPADAVETQKALFAVAEHNGPVYFRTSRPKTPIIYDDKYKFIIGKGSIIKEGNDITIISTGITLSIAKEAQEELSKQNINCRVVNLSTIKPIDKDIIISSAEKTGAIITIEEHSVIGGLGSAVAEVLAENFPVPLKRIGIQDIFGQSGTYEELFKFYGLTKENIKSCVFELLKKL
ncbi:MAG: transketolase family protein [Candidatus Firestonebacteria bacterium]|nr:transketolase family protein [Candidatus Firestonebacteria bacterium]